LVFADDSKCVQTRRTLAESFQRGSRSVTSSMVTRGLAIEVAKNLPIKSEQL